MEHRLHTVMSGCSLETSVVNERFAVTPGSQFASYVEDFIREELATSEDEEIRLLADQLYRGDEKWLALCLRHMRRKLLAEWSST